MYAKSTMNTERTRKVKEKEYGDTLSEQANLDEQKYLKLHDNFDHYYASLKEEIEDKLGIDMMRTDTFTTNKITCYEKQNLASPTEINLCESEIKREKEFDLKKIDTNVFFPNEAKPFDKESFELDGQFDLENIDISLFFPNIIMEVGDNPIKLKDDTPEEDPPINTVSNQLNAVLKTFNDTFEPFNLTTEENEVKNNIFGTINSVQYTKIHCTACMCHLGSALTAHKNICMHPLLKVLICRKCFDFYNSGEYEKDVDGSEMYCRWCGQGGEVICCAKCEMVFCKKCVLINFGKITLSEIMEDDKWNCFCCNPSPLINLKVHCAELMEYFQKEISCDLKLQKFSTFTNTDYTQCCTSEKVNIEEKKRKRSIKVDPDYNPYYGKMSRTSLMNVKNECTSPSKSQKMSQVTSLPKISYIQKITDVAKSSINSTATNLKDKLQEMGENIMLANGKDTSSLCAMPIEKEAEMQKTLSNLRFSTQIMHKLSNNVNTIKIQKGKLSIPTAEYIQTNAEKIIKLGTVPKIVLTPLPNNLTGQTIQKSINKLGTIHISPTSIINNLQMINTDNTNQHKINVLPRSFDDDTVNKESASQLDAFHRKIERCKKTIQLADHTSLNLSLSLVKLKQKGANAGNLNEMVAIHNELQKVLSLTSFAYANIQNDLGKTFKTDANSEGCLTKSTLLHQESVPKLENENILKSDTSETNSLVATKGGTLI